MVEPLFKSATAASASLKSFDPPRSIFGARDCNGAVVEYRELMLVELEVGCRGRKLARTPR
jgi:hypothetical protein